MRGLAAGALILLATASVAAQEAAPLGFIRGDLITWQGSPRAGIFRILVWPDHVYACSYDEQTDIQRSNRRINMDGLNKGDHLQIVSDRKAGSSECYASTIQLMGDPSVLPRAGLRSDSGFSTRAPVAGLYSDPWNVTTITLSGAVSSITPDALILRLRSGQHKMIRLGPLTHYFEDGQAADASALTGNTVVFVRASKNLRGEPEASQVIWGGILQPEP